MLMSSRLRLAALHLLSLLQPALSLVETRTIDDESGDSVTGVKPIYQGPRGWNYGPACPGCGVQPYAPYTFDRSWHDCTPHPTDTSPWNVTLTFTGTAIWVYCIMANTIEYITTYTNISFVLDGSPAGTFVHEPILTTSDYEYNVTIYSQQNLENREHTLVMTPVGKGGENSSLILFDWAIYLYDDGITTSSTTTSSTTTSSTTTSSTMPEAHTRPTIQPTSQSPTTVSVISSSKVSPSETQPIGAPTASTGPGITAFTSTSIPTFSSGTVETSSAVRGSAYNTSDHMSATRSVPFGPTSSTQMASGTSISHSSGARNFPVAIVAGAAAGGTAALIILILAICCVRRRRRASSDERSGDDRVSQARIPTRLLDATLPISMNSTLLERPSPHINDSWDSEEALLSGMSISGIRSDDPSSDTGISTFAPDTDPSLEGSHQEKVETHSDALPRYMSGMENSDSALQQQHRPSLRRHRLSLHPPASTGNVDVVPDNAATTHDEVEMRRQIELLRSEVERLRVEIEPPAYE